ncbi:MAG: DUF2254 domain-containing protein [Acidimicrobiia bacterium]|nr:DUF2254 domain-containing protein [Acidimicrobiia bacterium]
MLWSSVGGFTDVLPPVVVMLPPWFQRRPGIDPARDGLVSGSSSCGPGGAPTASNAGPHTPSRAVRVLGPRSRPDAVSQAGNRETGAMRLRLSSLKERVRASLFFVPMLAVIGAIAFGLVALGLDGHIDPATDLPLGFTSTVDSARVVLSTIAGATITFAGIAFSISLLTIQLASSQYSPRVVHTLFRDPFNKRVMALVVGTFTYCVVVLRSMRSSLEDGGDPNIPNLSVAIAVVLGITTILAIVAFINHSAHTMDISEILERVEHDAIVHIRDEWTSAGTGDGRHDPVPTVEEPVHIVRFERSGWVQQVDLDKLLECAPDDTLVRLDTFPGRYAVEGTPLCALSLPPENREQTERGLRNAIGLGGTRTMQQDVSYGLRQLADVALKALSPGINDPTTAQDAIFQVTPPSGSPWCRARWSVHARPRRDASAATSAGERREPTRRHTPSKTSAGAPACRPPRSSVRSSMFMAGIMRARDWPISAGGIEPMICRCTPTTASTPMAASRPGMMTRSSRSWWAR